MDSASENDDENKAVKERHEYNLCQKQLGLDLSTLLYSFFSYFSCSL